jgi:PhzF family phenazine biosynthesis protein
MTTAQLFHVDAFTTEPFAGNQAVVLVLEQEPGDDFCARAGEEFQQPATALTWPLGEPGRFGLRWFTAAGELALCGHGTLAAAHVLLSLGAAQDGQVRFETKAGPLSAEVADDLVQLRFPVLTPVSVDDRALEAAVRDLLGTPAREILRNDLDVMAVLSSAAEVRSARPDLAALVRLPVRGLIITAADAGEADFVSRFFSPSTGTDEDAVTGSAHCALAPYWIRRLGRQPLLGQQLSTRGGQVQVAQAGATVTLAGPALTLSTGTFHTASTP